MTRTATCPLLSCALIIVAVTVTHAAAAAQSAREQDLTATADSHGPPIRLLRSIRSDDLEDQAGPRSPSHVVGFDVASRREFDHFLKQLSSQKTGSLPGWRGPDDGPDTPLPRGFGDMSLVNDPTSWPARPNCRIAIQHTDSQGNEQTAYCSGVLIDARIVLTAGHCIYHHQDDDDDLLTGWANGATVTPATTGGSLPFGTASAIHFYTFTDWIDDADYDSDVGLIILDRPVGMLSGWMGWRAGVDCGYINSQAHQNYSYPAEDCDDGGPLHNGQDMYYWIGSFDGCEWVGWEVWFWIGDDCLDSLWRGASGSAAISAYDGELQAFAVASHKETFLGTADYVRTNYAFDELMFDEAIPLSRGSDFDLHAMRFRVFEPEVDAGETLWFSGFDACNPTNATGSGPRYYDIRLSENSTISGQDTYLDAGAFNINFPPMSIEWVAHGFLDIPINIPSGTYYIGAQLELGSDADGANNDSSGWDASEIIVNGGPQLAPTDIDVEYTSYVQGGPIDYTVQIINMGGDEAVDFRIDLKLAELYDFGSDGPYLGVILVPSIGPGETQTFSGTMYIPDDCPPGAYYVGVEVYVNGDLDHSDNTLVSGNTIGVFGQADMDDCEDTQQIVPGLHPFSTYGATTDGDAHDQCHDDGPYRDIWFRYLPPQLPCRFLVTTCEELGGTADFDTAIAVYTGVSCGSLTLLACNDDDVTQPCGYSQGGYQSTIEFVFTDEMYVGALWIRVGGHGESDWGLGQLLVEAEFAVNNRCEDALDLPLGLTAFDTTLATTDGPQHGECQWDGQTYNDIWYRFKATYPGMLTVTTCFDLGGDADYDTDLALYTGTCAVPVLLDCNDDDTQNWCGASPEYQSTVTTEVQAGDDILVRVGGYGTLSQGTGILNVTVVPVNDACENAIWFVPDELLWFTTFGATASGPDHVSCESNGDGGGTWNDIWYTFTAPCSGQFQVTTCNMVNYDSDLVLYQNECEDLELIACNDDACDGYGDGPGGRASDLTATVMQGVTYLLRVGGSEGGDGIGEGMLLTSCGPFSGDANGDGVVNILDMLMVLDNWNGTGPDGDLNNDGFVNIEDLLLVIGNWG